MSVDPWFLGIASDLRSTIWGPFLGQGEGEDEGNGADLLEEGSRISVLNPPTGPGN